MVSLAALLAAAALTAVPGGPKPVGVIPFDLYDGRISKAGALAAAEIDGLVGSRIMGRFRVLYDYSRRRVILELGPRLEEPFTHDMSGLRLRSRTLELRTIEVARAAEGSPAEAVGLRAGDLVLSVDGRPVRPFDLPEVRARLERPGPVRLETSRGGRRRTVVLELRPRV